jgi:hypothetical protein
MGTPTVKMSKIAVGIFDVRMLQDRDDEACVHVDLLSLGQPLRITLVAPWLTECPHQVIEFSSFHVLHG